MKSEFSSHSEEDEDVWPHKELTQEEAKALEASMPKISLWSVFAIQLIIGVLCIVVALCFSVDAGVSAAAGVLSVCLPTAFFVWRVNAVEAHKYGSHFTLMNFYLSEAVKVIGIIAMLTMAFFLLKPLIWQALLAGFIVTVKAYSVGCWLSWKKINR